eukprot:TRINITY_DN55597_c0_g1_i1.p1 TRINITY_DN55597_c0_g1~~TRINITY_DN55597_c0_g1_i1.p1  ORF type:complete len:838 (+),score=294.45 TRINITY_DN55597_c0_g1_i1:107-2620(+)
MAQSPRFADDDSVARAASWAAAEMGPEQEERLAATLFLARVQKRSAEELLDMEPLTWYRIFVKWVQYNWARLPIRRCLLHLSPMAKAVREIGIKYGANVLGYYSLAEWIVTLNFVMFIFWLVLLIVPWFQYWDDRNYEYNDDGVTRDVIDAQELVGNFFGYIDSGRVTDRTWFFYSGYLKDFDGYAVGFVYAILVLGSFLVALMAIVVDVGNNIAEVSRETTVARYQLPAVLYSWDWGLQSRSSTGEMLLATWMQLQAEFYEAMAKRLFREGEEVKAQYTESAPWEQARVTKLVFGGGIKCEFITGPHAGEAKELPIVDPPRDRVRKRTLCCGLTQTQLKGLGGRFLSLILCGGSLVVMYICVDQRDKMNESFPWVSSIVIAAVNGVIPFIQRKIVALEGIENPKDAVVQEVIRVFVIKMANAVLLYMSVKDLEKNSGENFQEGTCPEFLIGVMFQQLLVVDVATQIVTTIVGQSVMFKVMGKQQFNTSTEIINTLYRQCIVWIGMPYCPMLLLMGALVNWLLFFVKKVMMFKTCGVPEKPINDASAETLFKVLLLLSLVVASVPGISFLSTEKPYCGPHYDAGCNPELGQCSTPLDVLSAHIHHNWGLGEATFWIFQPVILFAAALTFMVAAYFLASAVVSGYRRLDRQKREFSEENKGLRELLTMAAEKSELLSPTSPDEAGQAVLSDAMAGKPMARRGSAVAGSKKREQMLRTAMLANRTKKQAGTWRRASMGVLAAKRRASVLADPAKIKEAAAQLGLASGEGDSMTAKLEDLCPYLDLAAMQEAIDRRATQMKPRGSAEGTAVQPPQGATGSGDGNAPDTAAAGLPGTVEES